MKGRTFSMIEWIIVAAILWTLALISMPASAQVEVVTQPFAKQGPPVGSREEFEFSTALADGLIVLCHAAVIAEDGAQSVWSDWINVTIASTGTLILGVTWPTHYSDGSSIEPGEVRSGMLTCIDDTAPPPPTGKTPNGFTDITITSS